MNAQEIKILLVDDELDILEIVGYNLKQEGYTVYTAINGDEAIEKAKKIVPDLIILDVMMPKTDGIEACRTIRKIEELKNTIIIFLTAKNEEYSQWVGYDVGADDYLAKPIKPKLLVTKINTLLRRLKNEKQGDLSIFIDDIEINREEYKVTKAGVDIFLPRKEFELFYLLASKPNKVFTRDEILEKIWGKDVFVGDRTIDVHIRKIRKKIGDNLFKTIKGVGYKFQ